jgi:hypothetical protein
MAVYCEHPCCHWYVKRVSPYTLITVFTHIGSSSKVLTEYNGEFGSAC